MLRRVGLLLALLLVTSSPASADDGSWYAAYDLAQGPLYALADNPDVSLDNELLVLEDYQKGTVTALFQFRNASDKPVTVDAGFPVVLDLEFSTASERNGAPSSEESSRDAYVVSTKHGAPDAKLLEAAGLRVREWKYTDDYDPDAHGPYFIREVDFPRKRIEKPVPAKPPFAFSIEQDGKPVKLTSMVVELDPKARPPIVFHFRHQLVLGPKATSVVRVRYQAPTESGLNSDGLSYTSQYTWKYVLHTGASWRGPLGKIVLAVPHDGKCEGQDRWQRLGIWGNYDVFTRRPFEPGVEDDLTCRWQRLAEPNWGYEDGEPTSWEKARSPHPDVTGVGASSSVKFTMDVYTEAGLIKSAPNLPESAFDGILETAWSEGAKTDAGEYLELELTKPAAGLRVMAGFLGTLHPTDRVAGKKAKVTNSLYTLNSRPRLLELVSADGTRKWSLPLADKKAQWNVFPILVPAGKYRLVIQSTYKGKKWQDTSIGEVDFQTGDVAWLAELRKDPFYAGFFADGAPYLVPYATGW